MVPPIPAPPRLELPETGLRQRARIVHALNRLAYGPRPGDVERIGTVGLATWIEHQLEPAADPSPEVERRLRALATLKLRPVDLLVAFPPPRLLRSIGRELSTDAAMDLEALHAYFPELAPRGPAGPDRRERDPDAEAPGQRAIERMLGGPERIVVELSQAKLVRAVHEEAQLREVLTDFWFNHFNVFHGKGAVTWWVSSYEADAIRPHAMGRFRDLLGAVARHPAMLFYLDNWLSSAPGTAVDAALLVPYAAAAIERAGLPPGGVLTRIMSERGLDTEEYERRMARRAERAIRDRESDDRPDRVDRRRRGLNENYARELLELHTLGVDGGYTQGDIVEVARCFTGWTLLPESAGQGFVFVPELHDPGPKVVLGQRIEAAGQAEGEAVLDLLARHPSTARFVSTKLARRFVGDEPPRDLIDAMARAFVESDGSIRHVLRTLVGSPAFWSEAAPRAKVKSPFEYLVSLVRATGAELAAPPSGAPGPQAELPVSSGEAVAPLVLLRELGQPLYGSRPPTGYADTAAAWVSAGSLLLRLKVAQALAAGQLRGVRVQDPPPAVPDVPLDAWVRDLGVRLFGQEPPASLLRTVTDELRLRPDERRGRGLSPHLATTAEARTRLATGWLLASPEFQRR